MEQGDGSQREGLRPGPLPIMGSVWPEEFIKFYPCLHLTHNLINSHAITPQRGSIWPVCVALGFVGERRHKLYKKWTVELL